MGRRSAHPIKRAESSTPAPLLTFRPSTFPTTGLGCGRTLLTAVFALASLVFLSNSNALAQGSVATDRAALEALYNATAGANWTNNTNWLSNAPLSEWHGVTTDTDERVTKLVLDSNQLTGSIPAALGSLTQLGYLWLESNQLTGTIPTGLGNLANLQRLYLGNNELSGSIPAALGGLTNLQRLALYDNKLSGSIPAALGGLTSLQRLWLLSNELSGSIPAALGGLTNLQRLYLHDNKLSGSIPAALGSLTNLQQLGLNLNRLTGSIPAALGNLTSLQWLYLSGNQLIGCVPEGLRDVRTNDLDALGLPFCGEAALEALYNATDGTNWTNNTNWLSNAPLSEWHGVVTDGEDRVTELSLPNNQLTGTIPAALKQLENLEELILYGNQLSGAIPAQLGNLSNLRRVSLDTDTGLCLAHDFLLTSFFATESGLSLCTEVFTLDFAHFANGASITSDLVFVNLSTQPVRPAIYFYDTEGALVSAESVVDVTGDLEIAEDGGLTVQTQMEPLGVLTVSTHGQGELVSGSVKAVSEGHPIGGGVRYNLPDIGVAGVGASPPISDALFPARQQAGGIRTAAALHNLEEEAMTMSCRLMSGGVVLEEVEIPLEANGQTSWFIDQAFPAADTSDFAGSVRCDAVGEGLFSAVALEMDPATRTFTTLPVFPVPEMPDRE